jgi:hypothetical protein
MILITYLLITYLRGRRTCDIHVLIVFRLGFGTDFQDMGTDNCTRTFEEAFQTLVFETNFNYTKDN